MAWLRDMTDITLDPDQSQLAPLTTCVMYMGQGSILLFYLAAQTTSVYICSHSFMNDGETGAIHHQLAVKVGSVIFPSRQYKAHMYTYVCSR